MYINMHAQLHQSCLSLCSPMLYSIRLLSPWDSPGKDTGVGCHFLLQGIFQTQGLNPCYLHLLHYSQILYHWARWQPTPIFSSGKSHGHRTLTGYSPWGYKRVGDNLVTKQQHIYMIVAFTICNLCKKMLY